MILPFVLVEPDVIHCLAIAPTLVFSVMFIVLYLVDQVHDLAEQLSLILQICCTVLAFTFIFINPSPSGALYGLFYCHQLVALCIDLYYVVKERGFALKK